MSYAPKGNRKYEVGHVRQRHREIMRLAILGMKYNEIAVVLQCSAQNVSDVLNSSIVGEEVKRLQEMRDGDAVDMSARITELVPIAIDVLEDSMEKDHDAKVRLIAAKDVLDRGGHAPAKRIEMKGIVGHVTVEDIAEITKRARLARNVVDDTDETSVEVVEEVTNEVQKGETTQ